MMKSGLVGIGKLGKALIKRFEENELPLLVYHPDSQKATEAVGDKEHCKAAALDELVEADYILLALPAGKAGDVADKLLQQPVNVDKLPALINLSTKDHTNDYRQQFPECDWVGVKLCGHAKALESEGNGLFVSEDWEAYADLAENFRKIGEIATGTEESVQRLNSQVTEAAVTVVAKLENELKQDGYDDVWIRHALRYTFPQVVIAYQNDELGTFAKEIAKKAMDSNSPE